MNVRTIYHMTLKLQSTLDNSNFKGQSKMCREISSSRQQYYDV